MNSSSIPVADPRDRRDGGRRWGSGWSFLRLVVGLIFSLLQGIAGAGEVGAHVERGYAYVHDEVSEIPWSIHVFKLARSRAEFSFSTTFGATNHIGMSTLSDQLRALDPDLGQPVAAVNGDFYTNESNAPGDPRDLQIHQGELVSAPAGHACFWLDAAGRPNSTNVVSLLACAFPNGVRRSMGLNEAREADALVLYTQRMGTSTRTQGGVELVVEPIGPNAGLPLRAELEITVKVRSVRRAGDSPIPSDAWILSLGQTVATKVPELREGMILQIETRTLPSMAGVQTAIGGGPTLVRGGRAMEWSGILMRHPRTAIGWNKEFIYLVEVDGRQSKLSVGMTFPELAAYLVKLGCEEAMNLDGGGSATLWVRGNVMNSPSEGKERPGANSLVVLQPRLRQARNP